MLIIKFAMVVFLAAMLAVTISRQNEGVLQGGPYYFLALPNNPNPVQPRYRLSPFKARSAKNVWKVWFDDRGHPVDLRLVQDKDVTYREKWLWDRQGRLRMKTN